MLDRAAYERLESGADVVDLAALRRLGDQLLGMGTAVVAIKLGEQGLYVQDLGAGAGVLRSPVAGRRTSGAIARSCRRASGRGASPGRPARATARSPASSPRCCAAKDRCRRRPARPRSAPSSVEAPDATSGVPPWPELAARIRAGGSVIPLTLTSADPTRNRHEIARHQARQHPRRTGQRARLHPRRRQGRRHGRRPRGDGRRSGHRQAAIAGRLPRPDARDRPPGAGRHHAHEREHQRRADDPGAAVRRVGGHARRPRQRHDRHPRGRRRGLHAGALAAVPHADDRADHERPRRPRTAASSGAAPTWGSTRSRRTTTSRSTSPRSRPTRNSASRPSARASATSSRCSTPTSRVRSGRRTSAASSTT